MEFLNNINDMIINHISGNNWDIKSLLAMWSLLPISFGIVIYMNSWMIDYIPGIRSLLRLIDRILLKLFN